MSRDVYTIYLANPVTTVSGSEVMYLQQPPFTSTNNNAGILSSSFKNNAIIRTVSVTPDTIIATDYELAINVASAVTENIPAPVASGRVLIFKDKSGSAATNHITIIPASGTIDGSANYAINTNRGYVVLIDDSVGDWSII